MSSPAQRPVRSPLSPQQRRARMLLRRVVALILLTGLVLTAYGVMLRPFDNRTPSASAPQPAPSTTPVSSSAASGPPTAPANTPVSGAPLGAPGGAPQSTSTPAPSETVDPSALVPAKGSGTWRALPLPQDSGTTRGKKVTFAVFLEEGIAGLDPAETGRLVAAAVDDPRGWAAVEKVHLVPARRGAEKSADFTVRIGTPGTTDKGCIGVATEGKLSCHIQGTAYVNARRWVGGSETYGSDLDAYRTYVINHELGHYLGHRHAPCPGAGRPAPVMLQQTISLQGCTPWPWPTSPKG